MFMVCAMMAWYGLESSKVLTPHFSHRAALVENCVMLRPLSRDPVFLAFSTFPPIVRPQPAPQAGGRGQCPLGYG
jgi:hypothetical protein